jgi:hypothetical protein
MQFKKYRGIIIGIIIVIILFSLWKWDIRRGRNDGRIISQQDLTEIRGTLSNRPVIKTAEQGGPWVPVKLNEFPDFNFDVGEVRFPALAAKEFTRELTPGDSIVLRILTYDYVTRIKKEKALRPSETIVNYTFIEPYSIEAKGKSYMTLADVNRAWQENHDVGWWMFYWVCGLVTVIGIVFLILYWMGFVRKLNEWWNDGKITEEH